MIRFDVDRDVEKSHGARLALNLPWDPSRGVSFLVQWRGWQPNWVDPNDHAKGVYDPWMLRVQIFVFGTFLWAHPHREGYWARRCASNGITLFNWTIFEPKEN